MKKLSLICSIFFLTVSAAQAQKNPTIKELEGSWKMFSMNIPGMMYFNSITDSFSMNPKMMGIEDLGNVDGSNDVMMMDMMKASIKKDFEKMFFKMDASGTMYESTPKSDSLNIMGNYDPTTGYITLKEMKEGDDGKLLVKLEDGVIHLIKQEGELTVTMSCKAKKD